MAGRLGHGVRRSSVLAAAALVFASAVGGAVSSAEAAQPSGVKAVNLCRTFSVASVSSVLGVRLLGVTGNLTRKGAVCWFSTSGNPQAAFVSFADGVTSKAFNTDRHNAALMRRNPVTLTMFKPYAAYAQTIPQAPFPSSHTVTVLKGKRELLVGSSSASLRAVENLTKKYLAKI